MTENVDWIPPLVLFETYNGNWARYLSALYAFFKKDFIDSKPLFRGTRLVLKRHPIKEGKEATFWHLISEGKIEDERLPNLRKCERIRWPRPIIEHLDEPIIKVWENKRKGKKRICLWLESREYVVILDKRKSYILFWTAYPVMQNHQKRKLQREYDRYKQARAAR